MNTVSSGSNRYSEKAPLKVTAFVGSARKKHTYIATEKFIYHLQSLGDIEYEIITLSDTRLAVCKGYRLCFDKGED